MTDVYKVKSWTYLYDAIASGIKTHDIRDMRDRNYKVGDILILQRYDMSTGQYTGEEQAIEITYITSNEVPCAFSSAVLDKNFAVLSVRKLSGAQEAAAFRLSTVIDQSAASDDIEYFAKKLEMSMKREPQLYDGAFGHEVKENWDYAIGQPLHS